jgi:hypothetical protein
MKITARCVPAFGLVLHMCVIAAAQAPDPVNEGKTLADIARETRAKPRVNVLAVNDDSQAEKGESQYEKEIQSLLGRDAFTELDAAADSARVSKDRIEGGAWKLFIFYGAVANPLAGGRATSTEWNQHVTKVQNWISARPQSITARVALAETYINLAWKARGGGASDTVSAGAGQQFETLIQLAQKTLVDAADFPAKCPQWYFDMMEIGKDQGWSKPQMRALFERAIAFEPAYYHYYRAYATNLLPKWNGEPGDAEAFADESYRRIGGRWGAFVYFEIASVLYCTCSSAPVTPSLSWPTLQQGFAEMEERYGATTLKLNRFAVLAYLYRDREVAKRTLERVKNQWDPTVWRNMDSFNFARNWAGLPNF